MKTWSLEISVVFSMPFRFPFLWFCNKFGCSLSICLLWAWLVITHFFVGFIYYHSYFLFHLYSYIMSTRHLSSREYSFSSSSNSNVYKRFIYIDTYIYTEFGREFLVVSSPCSTFFVACLWPSSFPFVFYSCNSPPPGFWLASLLYLI